MSPDINALISCYSELLLTWYYFTRHIVHNLTIAPVYFSPSPRLDERRTTTQSNSLDIITPVYYYRIVQLTI